MEDGELKVVVHLAGNQALVGIQEKGTDPVLERLEAANLQVALAAVPGMLQRAREQWATNPRNPAYQPPPPPPAPPSQPRQSVRQRPSEGQMQRLV